MTKLGHSRDGPSTSSRWLLLIVTLALAGRIVYAMLSARIDPFLRANPLHGDAGSYDRIARNLLAGDGFSEHPGTHTAFWPPLYPWLLAAMYGLSGYSLLAARLVQAVLGTVAVGATAMAARSAFGQRVGLLTAVGMALYPHLVYFGAWLIAEPLHLALLGLFLWVAAVQQSQPRARGFALLGALLGLASLAKPATLMMLPLVLLWTGLAFPVKPPRARLLWGVLVLAAAAALVLPWTVRNFMTFGAFVPVSTNGGYTFYGANNPDAFGGHREGFPLRLPGLTEPEAEDEYYRRGLDWIARHPLDFGRLTLRKLMRLFSPLSVASYEQDYLLPLAPLIRGVYAAFWILALAGALWSLPQWRQAAIFYAPMLSVLLGTVIFYGDARYTLPMAPSLVSFASLALVRLKDRIIARRVLLKAVALPNKGANHP